MRKIPLVVSGALVAAAVISPVASGLAASLSSPVGPVDPNAPLPTTSVVQMVVDSAHHQLFISTGGAANSLLVTNEAGVVTNTIALNGAHGLALDGTTLYVGESGASDIAVIDTSTLTVTRRLATGANTCPTSVAVVEFPVRRVRTCLRRAMGKRRCHRPDVCVADPSRSAGDQHLLQPDRAGYTEQHKRHRRRGRLVVASGEPRQRERQPDGSRSLNGISRTVARISKTSQSVLTGRTSCPPAGGPTTTTFSARPTCLRPTPTRLALYPDAAAFSPDGNAFAGGSGFSDASTFTSCRRRRATTHSVLPRSFRNAVGHRTAGCGFLQLTARRSSRSRKHGLAPARGRSPSTH